MTSKQDNLPILVILICAVGLVMALWPVPDPVRADALGLPLFDSPPPPPPDLADPGVEGPAHDPDSPDVSLYFHDDSLSAPVQVETFAIANLADFLEAEGLTDVVNLPTTDPALVADGQDQDAADDSSAGSDSSDSAAGSRASFEPNINSLFASGVWIQGGVDGKGTAMQEFNRTILITTKYDGSQIAPEAKIYMYMYNPQIGGWVKLCTLVDRTTQQISGLVSRMMPYEPGGNSLFAIGVDNTGTLEQTVDPATGDTHITLPDLPEVMLRVPAGTVAVGDNLEITPLIERDSSIVIDYKVCHLDHFDQKESEEVIAFEKSVTIEFELDTSLPVGASPSVLYQSQWFDAERLQTTANLLGSQAVYSYAPGQNQIVARTPSTGAYGYEMNMTDVIETIP